MSTRLVNVVTIMSLLGVAACSSNKTDAPKADASSGAGTTAPLGSAWTDISKMPDFFSGMWMSLNPMIESDEALVPPFTDTAKAYVAQYKFKRDIPYAEKGCLTPGLPISMRSGPIKFSYEPGLISIYMQGVGDNRFIKLNSQQGQTTPKYYGNSVAHWEGDTLVVETVDFMDGTSFQYGLGKGLPPTNLRGPNAQSDGSGPPPGGLPSGVPPLGGPPAGGPPGGAPPAGGPPGGLPPGALPPGGPGDLSKAIWGSHGPNMHMVERMHLVDPETLEIQLTMYDDSVWTKPYETQKRTWRRIRKGISEFGPFTGEPEEWVCTASITSFDPKTNSYQDADPEEMVKYLEGLGK
jgi:hypothetical protein